MNNLDCPIFAATLIQCFSSTLSGLVGLVVGISLCANIELNDSSQRACIITLFAMAAFLMAWISFENFAGG